MTFLVFFFVRRAGAQIAGGPARWAGAQIGIAVPSFSLENPFLVFFFQKNDVYVDMFGKKYLRKLVYVTVTVNSRSQGFFLPIP